MNKNMDKIAYTSAEKRKLSDIVLSDGWKKLFDSGKLPEYFNDNDQYVWDDVFKDKSDFEHYLKICVMKSTM